ncbi:hypothetical protein CXB51_029816 [Gossypium anomalum]|uniref:Integrase catalytic domain-containing protein n=1 Tax=Gossypium anomalum TaxID=47600 RepID=A0A8J6CTK5_9ROSI|nr:hypothetical protein CXB51_029816 [Gossypium anomalum]
MATKTIPDAVPVVDTPRYSSSPGEAVYSHGSGSICTPTVHYFSKHDTIKLADHNFLLWKHQLLLILEGYGLEGFVLDDILAHLTTAKTSFDIWMTIERRFSAKSTIKVSSIRHALYSLKKANLSVKEYVSKVKCLSDNLTAAGSFVSEQEQVSVILAGLSLEFESIRVFASATPLSLDLLIEILLDCEARQLEVLTEAPYQANLASRQPATNDGSKQSVESSRYSQDHKQGSRGQGRGWSRSRFKGQNRGWSRSRPQCQLCGKVRHLVQTCYHRFDENFSGVGSTNSISVNYHQLHGQDCSSCSSISHCSGSCPQPLSGQQISQAHGSSPPSQVWYPDSGATNHITSDMANLATASSYTGTSQVSMGDGASVPIAHVGSSHFMAGSRLLRLQTVLHVPTVCKNLMSVGQFARDNAVYFEFHPYLCFVKDLQTKKTLLVGYMHKGLYRFDFSRSSRAGVDVRQSQSPVIYTAQVLSPVLWHNRLGHPCVTTLTKVLRSCNVSFKNISLPNICTVCQLGKSHKLPFTSSQTVYSSPFELVLSDVWGPAHVQSNGFSYYVSFVDMHSRYTCQGFSKRLGGEYRSLSNELSRLGIHHRITCPHTSEQNGVAERKHRQIVEMGLTLLAQSSVPLKFWSYAFAHATHLFNRLPTPVLNHISPYEKLFRLQPVYSQLKVFGCACFPHLRPFNQHKLQFQSAKCVFLSVGDNQKGYKYLTTTGGVLISRHSYVPLVLQSPSPSSTSSSFSKPSRGSPVTALGSSNASLPMSSGSSAAAGISVRSTFPIRSDSSEPTDNLALSDQPDSSTRCILTTNLHPMQTWSKSGVFKPKVFSSVLTDKEPSSISEAFQSP